MPPSHGGSTSTRLAGESLLDTLVGCSRGNRLIVLDNFEQVVAAAPDLALHTGACAGPHPPGDQPGGVACHGRTRLDRTAAGPSRTRASGCPTTVLLASPAVQLFVQRAQAGHPPFVLTEATARPWRKSVSGWRGYPWRSNWRRRGAGCCPRRRYWHGPRPAALVPHRRRGDALERQQSLRAAIAWSYALHRPRPRRCSGGPGLFVSRRDLGRGRRP